MATCGAAHPGVKSTGTRPSLGQVGTMIDPASRQADQLGFQQGLYSSANPTRRWLHNRRLDWLVRAVDSVWARGAADAPGPRTALEVGVGCCILTAHLAPRFRTLAIDIDPALLDEAAKLSVSVAQLDVCDAPALLAQVRTHAPEDGVDLAVCSEVLEHVPSPAAALAGLHACLRPGGILIVTTPQRNSIAELVAGLLRYRWMRFVARTIYGERVEPLGHISLMSASEFRAAATDCGFNVLEHDVLGAYLPFVAEFTGRPGQRFLAKLESAMRRTALTAPLLWTQCWVLAKSADVADS